MLDYQYVLSRLGERKLTFREIADGSKVPYDTVTKIAQGHTKNPRVETLQKLHDYFRNLKAR